MPVTETDFQQLSERVDQAEAALNELAADARAKALDLKAAVEAFHGYALRQLVRLFRTEEAGMALLQRSLEDPAVYAMFLMHGIIKQPVESQAEAALAEIRPYIQSHGGDVELVRVEGDTAYVRLQGACAGCSLSAVTLRDGVEELIKARVPEIAHVVALSDEITPGFIPLGFEENTDDLEAAGWIKGPLASELKEGRPHRFVHGDRDVLIALVDGKVMAFRNQCPHMGKPLDQGLVDGNVITCPWHGFRFDLSSGECLTVPHVQLEPFPVRLAHAHVWVRPQ